MTNFELARIEEVVSAVSIGLVAFAAGGNQILDFGDESCCLFVHNEWIQMIPFRHCITAVGACNIVRIHFQNGESGSYLLIGWLNARYDSVYE